MELIDFKINNDETGFKHGVYLTEQPAIPSSQREVTTTTVPGREHGSLTELGGWLDSQLTLTVSAFSMTELKANLREIVGWLYSAKEIEFNDDEKFYYKIKTVSIDEITNQLGLFGAFNVQMVIDPFVYQRVRALEFDTTPFQVVNPGSRSSEPMIKLYGDGDLTLTINGTSLKVSNVDGSVTLDSEKMTAISGTVNVEQSMTGEYPILEKGLNIIETSNVTAIELQPNWSWLT